MTTKLFVKSIDCGCKYDTNKEITNEETMIQKCPHVDIRLIDSGDKRVMFHEL